MSATTIAKQPRLRRHERPGPTATQRPVRDGMRAAYARLRGRFTFARFPAYVSAFEAEHLAALAAWSDCRTGMTGQTSVEERQEHGRWT